MTKAEAKIFHTFHRDPTCDVVIRSKDNIYFRASTYRLSEASTFFADLWTLPNKSKDKTIDIDSSASTIATFLTIINSEIPSIPLLTIPEAHELKRLSDKFLCKKKIIQPIKESLETAGRKQPFDLFIAAGEYNDVELGKMALGMIEWSHNPIVSNVVLFNEFLDRLPPTWQLELLRNVHESVGPSIFVRKDWSDIGKRFSPRTRIDGLCKKRKFDD